MRTIPALPSEFPAAKPDSDEIDYMRSVEGRSGGRCQGHGQAQCPGGHQPATKRSLGQCLLQNV